MAAVPPVCHSAAGWLLGSLLSEGHEHLSTLPLFPLGQAVEGLGEQRRGLPLSFCSDSMGQPQHLLVLEDGAVLSPTEHPPLGTAVTNPH